MLQKKMIVSFVLMALVSTITNTLPPCTSTEPITNVYNSKLYASVVEANTVFAASYTAQPNMFANDNAIVLTCMDPRLLPNLFMGFTSGDMFVIRNAGGVVTRDTLRSIVTACKLLGANQIFVVQHTDCLMQTFTQDQMTGLLEETIVGAELVQPCETSTDPIKCTWNNTCEGCGKKCKEYDCIDWYTIRSNLSKSVTKAVKKIRKYPLIPSDIPIYGFYFDVTTGLLTPVKEAIHVGKAKPLHCQ